MNDLGQSLMKKTLIAVAGCHKYQARADTQRQTWIKHVDAATDVRFFLGDPHTGKRSPDEIWLDCPDSYVERKQKIVAIIRWAVEHDYAYLWKVDDDVYVRPERLLSLESSDYCGAIVGYDTVFSGALYGLSRCSMEKLLTPDNTFAWQKYEDLWVWNRLNELGVAPLNLGGEGGVHGRFRMTHRKGEPVRVNQDPPRPGNDVIASWEYITPAQMNEIHSAFDATQYATEATSVAQSSRGAAPVSGDSFSKQ